MMSHILREKSNVRFAWIHKQCVGALTHLRPQCLPTMLMDWHTESIDPVTFFWWRLVVPQQDHGTSQKDSKYLWNALALNPDLWSLPEQLLLLQPQPFLLDLLQSHLIVASHDCAVLGGQLASWLHWGTLGDPLLVQGCIRDRDKSSNLSPLSNNIPCRDTSTHFKLSKSQICTKYIIFHYTILQRRKRTVILNWGFQLCLNASLAPGTEDIWQFFMFYFLLLFLHVQTW